MSDCVLPEASADDFGHDNVELRYRGFDEPFEPFVLRHALLAVTGVGSQAFSLPGLQRIQS